MKTLARALRSATLVAILSIVVGGSAEAQVYLSPVIGYDVDFEEITIGGTARFPISSAQIAGNPLSIQPGFHYYPGISGATLFVIDADGIVQLPTESIESYVGAGLNFARISSGGFSNTDVGLNALGGIRFGTAQIKPFVEARLRINDGSTLVALFGLQFAVGGNQM